MAVRYCTIRRDITHKIKELKVLYPWYPWGMDHRIRRLFCCHGYVGNHLGKFGGKTNGESQNALRLKGIESRLSANLSRSEPGEVLGNLIPFKVEKSAIVYE